MITSLVNQKVKDLVKLQTKRGREKQGLFLIEGFHLVEEAKKAGYLVEVLCTEDVEFDFDNVTLCKFEVIEKIATTKSPQPILGVAKLKEQGTIGKKLLCLDNVQDPGNVGTLIRSAIAFGFDTIVISPDSADVLSPKVLRATQGAIFSANVVRDYILDVLDDFKGTVYATALDQKALKLNDVQATDSVAIILGNEGNGVAKDLIEAANDTIYIEIKGTESLNVAIAGSIVMNKFK